MATQEKKTQVENKSKGKVSYPLTKINFILMAICLLLIIIGFWLMTGDANVGEFRDALVVDAEPHELIVKLI